MLVHLRTSALRQTTKFEYLIRFVLGGLATVATGFIAQKWGPDYGGLFLAFPAIFSASATLIEKHERRRKQARGLAGAERGKQAAALDAAGAALGSMGLLGFGAVMWLLLNQWGWLTLGVAMAVWALLSVLLWAARQWIRIW